MPALTLAPPPLSTRPLPCEAGWLSYDSLAYGSLGALVPRVPSSTATLGLLGRTCRTSRRHNHPSPLFPSLLRQLSSTPRFLNRCVRGVLGLSTWCPAGRAPYPNSPLKLRSRRGRFGRIARLRLALARLRLARSGHRAQARKPAYPPPVFLNTMVDHTHLLSPGVSEHHGGPCPPTIPR